MRNNSQSKFQQKFPNNVPLEHFKKQNNTILKRYQNYIKVTLSSNKILLALALMYLYRMFKDNHFHIVQKQISQIQLKIQNFPRDFQQYNHQQTIRAVLLSVITRLEKRNDWAQWIDIINQFPIACLSLVVYMRSKGKRELDTNKSSYEFQMMGNQTQLLDNYSSQLRNLPLLIIVNSLNLKIDIDWKHSKQIIGEGTQTLKIQIINNQFRFQVSQQTEKSLSNQLSSNLSQLKNYSLQKSTNSSVSKLGKACPKCGKIKTTKFCQCRKSTPSKPSVKPFSQINTRQFQPIQFYLNYRNRQKQN